MAGAARLTPARRTALWRVSNHVLESFEDMIWTAGHRGAFAERNARHGIHTRRRCTSRNRVRIHGKEMPRPNPLLVKATLLNMSNDFRAQSNAAQGGCPPHMQIVPQVFYTNQCQSLSNMGATPHLALNNPTPNTCKTQHGASKRAHMD